MSSFRGLGATRAEDSENDDDCSNSTSSNIIHQDSDDDEPIHDDDIDIGFRRHQYETAGNRQRHRPRRSRQQAKDDAIYGIFLEEPDRQSHTKTYNNNNDHAVPKGAPIFVPASKKNEEKDPPLFVQSTTVDETHPSQPTTKKTEEETPEEREMQEQQKSADQYFQSLLQQAQSRKKRRRDEPPGDTSNRASMPIHMDWEQPQNSSPPKKKDPTVAIWEKHEKGIGSKLLFKMGWKGSGGLGSNRRKFQSTNTDANNNTKNDNTTTTNITKTTTTSTSSSEPTSKKGISRPVEVVVRPANLGLGFGNFKEMSKLKSNLQIEATVRGIQLPKMKQKRGVLDIMDMDMNNNNYDNDNDNDEDDNNLGPSNRNASSAIPTTQELMTQQAWKRRKTKRAPPKIIPYQDLVAQHEQQNIGQQPVIIDMRGPSSASAGTGTASEGKVPLGEELLHNITFMLNTHENQLHSYSQIIKSTERKEMSLQSEITDLHRQQDEAKNRREMLEHAMTVVQKIENIAQQEQQSQQSPSSTSNSNKTIDQVTQWIEELGASFTPDDRVELKFWQTLAPALLSPILEIKLKQWDPLGPMQPTKVLLDSIIHMRWRKSRNQNLQDKEALSELRNSILQNQLLPRIKQVLESNRWDPSLQTEVVLDMYEYLQSLTQAESAKDVPSVNEENYPEDQVLSGGPIDEDHADISMDANLSDFLRKELVLDTIYPKIQATLSHWKPSLQPGNRMVLEQRLDLWILPWIPHLDHPAIFSNLLSDCKRKLKSSLSHLQRKLGKVDDIEFVRAAMEILKPWTRVYDVKGLQRMCSEYITPYLARALAKQKVHRDASKQVWTSVRLTFEMHACGILSTIEFLSLMEAELLCHWASKVNEMMEAKDVSVQQAATIYCLWKKEILVNPYSKSITLKPSVQLLQNDDRICRIFYMVLRMIELMYQSKMDEVEDLYPPPTNYHVVSARRTKERQHLVQDEFVRMESRSQSEFDARLRLRRRQIDTPSFRDVVEEFASERGILFQPRMGAKALKDGKQVFMFGDIPIYIEGDVIFAAQQASVWRPTSLDQLMDSTEGKD